MTTDQEMSAPLLWTSRSQVYVWFSLLLSLQMSQTTRHVCLPLLWILIVSKSLKSELFLFQYLQKLDRRPVCLRLCSGLQKLQNKSKSSPCSLSFLSQYISKKHQSLVQTTACLVLSALAFARLPKPQSIYNVCPYLCLLAQKRFTKGPCSKLFLSAQIRKK